MASIRVCQSGFAQHVVGMRIALPHTRLGALHCAFDRFPQNKLTPHFLHRTTDSFADHRLAQASHKAAQRARNTGLRAQNTAREQKPPCGGIDQRRRGVAKMPGPIPRRDLVLNQGIDRGGIGHAQKRLRQTHQSDTLSRGQTVFGEENFHEARLGGGADLFHPTAGRICHPAPPFWRKMRRVHDGADHCGFAGRQRAQSRRRLGNDVFGADGRRMMRHDEMMPHSCKAI